MGRKSAKLIKEQCIGKSIRNTSKSQHRILIGVPMTGLLRSEWVLARYGQTVPCNWSQAEYIHWIDQYSPIQFSVADARNLIADVTVREGYEWLFYLDHDVVLPAVTLLRLNEYMLKADIPIIGGLYFTRSVPSEPLVYRGRGNSYYNKWTLGEKIWVDGMGLGCNLIHSSILKAMWEESEEYQMGGRKIRRIFETPSRCWFDPEMGGWQSEVGTEDLAWYTRIMDQGILKKAGWSKIAKRRYPYLCDTSLFCAHIDWDGIQYPSRGEQVAFLPKGGDPKLGVK